MAIGETARLIASLQLDDKFSPAASKILRSVDKLDAGVSRTGSRSFRAGQQIGTGIKAGALIAGSAIGFLATNVGLGLRSLEQLETVTTQSNAVLKSTKGAAGQTAESIRNLAEKYEGLNATIDDKVIQSGENVLLTFTNIRKQAFEPALKAALDLSTAMGQDLQSSVVQIGKALNDPIKGITALTRVGVSFTAQQKEQIKALVKTGDVMGAQKIILGELNREFGGSFLAGGQTTAGKVAKFKDAIEDLQKALATALLPVIGKVSDALTRFLADPKVIQTITELGQKIASLFSDKNLAEGGRFLQGAFETARAAAPIIEASAKATLGLIQSAVALFKSLPPGLQGLLAGGFALNKLTGGLVTNLAGGVFDQIKDILGKSRGGTPANPLFVSDVSGGLGAGPTSAAGKIGSVVQKVFLVGMLAEVASLIAGPVQDLGSDIHRLIDPNGTDPFSQFGKAWDDWRKNADWPFGQKNAPSWLGGPGPQPPGPTGIAPAGATAGDGSDARGMAATLTGISTYTHMGALATNRVKDDIVDLKQLARAAAIASSEGFHRMVDSIRNAKGPAEIKAAVKHAIDLLINKGQGNLHSTITTLTALKAQLKNVHDPATRAALQAAINKVEHKVPGRELVQKQINEARNLVADGKLTKAELTRMKAIQRNLLAHGDRHAAATVGHLITVANRQRSTTAAVNLARIQANAKQQLIADRLKFGLNALGGILNSGNHPGKDSNNAVGGVWMTNGPTRIGAGIGIAGEAGGEAVAIVSRPRPLAPQPEQPIVVNVAAPKWSTRDFEKNRRTMAKIGPVLA